MAYTIHSERASQDERAERRRIRREARQAQANLDALNARIATFNQHTRDLRELNAPPLREIPTLPPIRLPRSSSDDDSVSGEQPTANANNSTNNSGDNANRISNGAGNAIDEAGRVDGHTRVFSYLTTLISLMVLVHFIITNVLIFSSTKTCRVTSPHLWWASLSMLIITYMLVLELIVIGFSIFVIMPIIFVRTLLPTPGAC